MNKKLPSLYANVIDKQINNNKQIFYSLADDIFKKSKSIEKKKRPDNDKMIESEVINNKVQELFDSPNYVYKMKTTITLSDNSVLTKEVIGRKDNKLITMDEDMIDINDIKEIKF